MKIALSPTRYDTDRKKAAFFGRQPTAAEQTQIAAKLATMQNKTPQELQDKTGKVAADSTKTKP